MKKTILNMLGQLLADFLEQAGFAHRKQTVGDGLRSPKEKQRIVEGVRKFFDENYELRYNVMKQTEEFRPRRQQEPVSPQQEPAFSGKDPGNFQEEVPNFGKAPPSTAVTSGTDGPTTSAGWQGACPPVTTAGPTTSTAGCWRRHVKAADVPTITALTAALKAGHFSRGKVKGVRGWYARQLRETENGSANRCDTDT